MINTSIQIDGKNLFNSEGSSPYYLQTTSNDVNDLYEEFLKWQKENKENKGDKNMEKVKNNKEDSIDKILEIYRKDVIKMIDATTDENIAEIRKKSKLGQIFEKVLKYSEKQIKDAFPDNFEIAKNLIYISFDNDGKMQRQIDEEISKRSEAIESLDETLKDVKALLNITETYEQKMDILKRYEILDKDGLLV